MSNINKYAVYCDDFGYFTGKIFEDWWTLLESDAARLDVELANRFARMLQWIWNDSEGSKDKNRKYEVVLLD